MLLVRVAARKWINLDTVEMVDDNNNGTYTVTLVSGAVFPNVQQAAAWAIFPDLIPPPPPVDPLPLVPPATGVPGGGD